jgi:mRNA interferase MazF
MVVVSHDAFNSNARYGKVLVLHLTSVRRPGGSFPWEVAVPRGTGGLPHASVVKCAEVYTVFKSQLVDRIGTLPAGLVAAIDRALAHALGLPATASDSW